MHVKKLLSAFLVSAASLCGSLALFTIAMAQGPSLSGTVEEFDTDKRILTLKTNQGVAHALSVPAGVMSSDIKEQLKEGQQVSVQLDSEGAIAKIDPDGPAAKPIAPRSDSPGSR